MYINKKTYTSMTDKPSSIMQDEQQQKAVDEALQDAKQNTTKGQIYQQFYSILVFIALLCCFFSYTILRLFDLYGDQSLRYPGYLYGSDFYLNVKEVLNNDQNSLRPFISSHFHHDYYACSNLRFKQTQNFTYNFEYNNKASQNGINFTVPAKYNSNVLIDIIYDKTQEITLIDQLCVQQKCLQLKQLPNYDFRNELLCKSNKPCVFNILFKPIRQQIFNITLKVQLSQQRIDTEDCYFFYKEFDFQEQQYLVIKSNLNESQLQHPPTLKIEHQTDFTLKSQKAIGVGSGIVVFVVLVVMYISSKNNWESSIKNKVVLEVVNKQKVQQHIDKIKQAMKNEKEKK